MNTFNTTNLTDTTPTANTVDATSASFVDYGASGIGKFDVKPSVGRQVIAIAGFLVVVAAIALIGSLSTMQHTDGWYADVERVAWSPPNAIFGPVWSVLYAAIALAGFLIWKAGFAGKGHPNRARGTLWLYIVQLMLNFAWTPVFFSGYAAIGEPAWWIALVIIVALIISVIWLIAASVRWSKAAAWIFVPYLAWLIFASTLNAGIIALN